MAWVMPPASPATTLASRMRSRSFVLPWSTWPMTVMIGGRVLGVVVVVVEEVVHAEHLLELDLLLLARVDEADRRTDLVGEELDLLVAHGVRGRDHLAQLHEEAHDVGRGAVELGAELLGRGRALDDDLAVGDGCVRRRVRREVHRLELLAAPTPTPALATRADAAAGHGRHRDDHRGHHRDRRPGHRDRRRPAGGWGRSRDAPPGPPAGRTGGRTADATAGRRRVRAAHRPTGGDGTAAAHARAAAGSACRCPSAGAGRRGVRRGRGAAGARAAGAGAALAAAGARARRGRGAAGAAGRGRRGGRAAAARRRGRGWRRGRGTTGGAARRRGGGTGGDGGRADRLLLDRGGAAPGARCRSR